MKKKLALALVMTMAVMSLAGCGSSSTANSDAAGSGESDTASAGTAELVDLDEESYISGINVDDYVELGEYKGISVEEVAPSVSDDLVNMYINYYFAPSVAKEDVTDRAVQDGDVVNIDYTGTLKETGKEFDGGSATDYDLTIGSNSFIDGFETGLIGAETGDTKDLDITFPDDYSNADLAGKEVVFSVKINSIQVTPDLSDENVSTLGISGVESLDDLNTYVHDNLMSQAQSTYDSDVQNAVLDAVEAKCVFQNPPESMVSRFTMELNNSLERQAEYYSAQYGSSVTPDDILSSSMSGESYSGTSDEYLRSLAIRQCNMMIMLSAIAQKEDITVTDAEVSESSQSALSSYGYSDLDEYSEAVGMDMNEVMHEEVLAQKVLTFLTDNAVVTEPADSSASSSASTDASTAASDAASSASSAE